MKYTCAVTSRHGQRGTTTHMCARIQGKQTHIFKKREKKKWTRRKPKTEGQTVKFKKKAMEKNEGTEDDLDIFTGTSRLLPKAERENLTMSIPENVRHVRKPRRDALQRS